MFARRGQRRPAPAPAANPSGVTVAAVAVACPDAPAITRERALRHWTGRTLQGHSGLVVDYDRGNVAHSVTTVFDSVHTPANTPTDAIAGIGMRNLAALPQTEAYDAATNDPELSAYQAALLMRVAR